MSKKIEIIPAILPKDFNELEERVELVRGSVKTVQVDVCDGQFVQNASWPYRKRDDAFEMLLKEEEGLPGWQDLNYEFDLMVNHPSGVVDEWVSAGAVRIIIHVESKGNIAEAVNKLQGRAEIGLALNVETPIESIEPYKGRIQFVQCMGIDDIGFQGQEFDAKAVDKIKTVKAAYPDLPISVDGGVSLDNAPSLIAAGADRLVIGSAIFDADNAFEAIQRFKKL
jgi:ribulose-phosphate 3-epimerase